MLDTKTIVAKVFLSVIFFKLIDQGCAIKCYKCNVTPNYRADTNTTTQICSKFDESRNFEVDCPYSTMCLKKVHKLELQNGQTVETITRGCANQKFTDQVLDKGGWTTELKVEEPYEEGCRNLKENNLSASSTTYCHCRGSLCNSATKELSTYHTDAMAVIFVFNAVKYLRSGVVQY